MKNTLLITFLVLLGITSQAQKKRALFLGNSYTNAYNLPQIVADLASSVNDTLFFDSNTSGGSTLQGHTTNSTTLEKIAQGKWDFVILQEQSQRPSLPIDQVLTSVFPYARILDSLINESNPCGETTFFMTWGRKYGDSENCSWWPPVCTYQGMDSLLNLRYMMMADSNNAIVSPVGAVWNYIINNHPEIELYSMDESHPSEAGSYAAACSFYTTFFRKDPSLLLYDFNLSPSEAAIIKQATKTVVYDSLLKWHIGEYDHSVDFSFEHADTWQIQFFNLSQNAIGQLWDFGNSTDTTENPLHSYPGWGDYPVTLYSYSQCDTLSMTQNVSIYYPGISPVDSKNAISFSPNPAKDFITIFNGEGMTISATIFDVTGKNVLNIEKVVDNKIDISLLKKGVYFIIFGQQVKSQKLIIR